MAMPLRTILPATAILADERGALRFSAALASTRNSCCNKSPGLFSRPMKTTRFPPPLRAASDPIGSSTSVATSEGLTGALERVEVLDITGKAIRLTDLWRDRKALIAFARHFGCIFCRKRADLLAAKKELMDEAGVTLVLIGPGSTEQAKAFVNQTGFKGEVYADPTHSSYDALNFAYGVLTTFTPSAGMKIVQLYLEGYKQDWELSFQRDTVARGGWQQGGIMVAGPGVSNILYIHKDKEAGDDPDIEEVIKACCS
ncbi:thioredoxin-like protein AAED1, chloroplastic [Canna indica]|uniref:Thioredoxin-like protein AAED1, chloroplastic n=1 Tax=Canna indica TaxID=4628 RepID=A0AAQ3QNS7_9LILI|nr:thioredoxin-like protein AAED1, chloroplastic [Canna indica]